MIVPKLSCWQIYFNKESQLQLDKGFIPYNNTGKETLFFENGVIIDVWNNQKHLWKNSDYVGILSWRFKEKTKLNFSDINNKILNDKNKLEVYSLMPSIYDKLHSPYSDYGLKNIQIICKLMDKYNLFPFKVSGTDVINTNENTKLKNFCNYWICKPEIFDDYVNNYLVKLFTWLQICNDPILHQQLRIMVNHRGQLYPVHPFIMEGLFECYVNYKGFSHENIRI